jgi:hypothetical protein
VNALAKIRCEQQIPAVVPGEERHHPTSRGKRPTNPGIWLEAADGEVLRLPLSGGSAQGAGDLVLMSCAGTDTSGRAVDGESLRAARWLMPSLSPELIVEALEW